MMDLFGKKEDLNLLPFDGVASYYGIIFNPRESKDYFEKLFASIAWKNDEVVIYGKRMITKRKTAWYGDSNYLYTYSNVTKEALVWTKDLLALKKIVEEKSGSDFNSCLLNLYHDGHDGMAWHSDDEEALGPNPIIASLSFGAPRKFSLKHKASKQTRSIVLEHGSMLVMKGATQTYWTHSLPKSKLIKTPRINLTFRTIVKSI